MLKTHKYLTYAGAIPFIACAVMSFMDIISLKYLCAYAFAIGVFISGSHWGLSLLIRNKQFAGITAIISNCFTIITCICFVALTYTQFLLAQAMVFLCLLAIDYKLNQQAIIKNEYLNIRLKITSIVFTIVIVSYLIQELNQKL